MHASVLGTTRIAFRSHRGIWNSLKERLTASQCLALTVKGVTTLNERQRHEWNAYDVLIVLGGRPGPANAVLSS